jgi:FtsZ-binding cell division protein ZapB
MVATINLLEMEIEELLDKLNLTMSQVELSEEVMVVTKTHLTQLLEEGMLALKTQEELS